MLQSLRLLSRQLAFILERHGRGAFMQPFSLRGLLQKEPFWYCSPSPSMQPAGVDGISLIEGWGRNPDAFWSSIWPPDHQLLSLLSRQHGWDRSSHRDVVHCAESLQGRAAGHTSEVVLQHGQVCDRDGALCATGGTLCREVASSSRQASVRAE